jgi:lipid-binding SYLF domain-containing protein
MVKVRVGAALLALGLMATTAVTVRFGEAASAATIDREVDAALAALYASVPEAQNLGKQARGILVFPAIVKAGFLFGAQYGEGALRRQGRSVGYFNSVAASYGLQAGVQTFGYALFFMSDSALHYLDQSQGFEIGTGPSVVILDAGKAKALTTTTIQSEIYAFIFDQKGLMAGLGLQGSKISRLDK